jgi:hypothetical protein
MKINDTKTNEILVKNIAAFLDFMKLDAVPIISVDFLNWLITQDFFIKPAAIKYHGNYTGGLFEHSLAVAEKLVKMTKEMNLTWQDPRSPYIIGMFHDLCKTDDYIVQKTSQLSDNWLWDYNNNKILTGHGDKSVMFLSQFINLTEEELFCIRFHMGAYETDDWDGYDKAIRKYEAVLWTHTADMWASKVLDK